MKCDALADDDEAMAIRAEFQAASARHWAKKCDSLKAQLATAVVALEEITTNWNCKVNYACVQIAREALAKIRENP